MFGGFVVDVFRQYLLPIIVGVGIRVSRLMSLLLSISPIVNPHAEVFRQWVTVIALGVVICIPIAIITYYVLSKAFHWGFGL